MVFNMTTVNNPVAFSELNIFERGWKASFDLFESEILATAVISFIMHEVVYFGRCLPFWIADFIPQFQKYKLQPGKVNTVANQWECMKAVLFIHFVYELPLISAFHPFAKIFGLEIGVPFPSWQKMAYQVAFCFLFEDTVHYWLHRLLHYGPFYKHIHKMHHEYAAPFGLCAEYAHPLEIMILGVGTIGAPLAWVCITHDLHLITVFVWITLRLFQSIDAHSGYDFPWSLRHFVPFWAGAEHHDFHHMAFVNCFATSFRWWDHIMGTDVRYKAYRKKQAAEARANEQAKAAKKVQ